MKLDLIDVFGTRPLAGNPLGVVHGGEGLDDAAMLALTFWLGFSETTFLLPPTEPEADYRVRIFCLARELDFAGHPTLGSCQAWLEAGGVPTRADRTVQQCGIGLVEILREEDRLAFRAPPLIRSGPLSPAELAAAASIAGVKAEDVVEAVHVSNGPNWQLLRLASAEAVLAAEPAAKAPAGTDVGLVGPWDSADDADWELRTFFANHLGHIVEDPVTGSFNACVAMHLFAHGLASESYIAAQGRKTGADGRVHCSIDAEGAVWVGGKVATIARGAELAGFT